MEHLGETRVLVGIAVLLVTLCPAAEAQIPPADLVVHHAKVWTVDDKNPKAQAVAVRGNRIVAVGTDEQIAPLRGPDTQVIDAGGRLLLPGFGDSHVHVLSGGRLLAQIQLKDAQTPEEFLERLRDHAATLPAGRWILGGNWDHDRSFGGTLPTAALIDEAAGDHPVFIDRYDGHMALVNTKVLEMAGITAATKDPAGGVIVRGEEGKPTGILRDNAMSLAAKLIPQPSDIEIVEGVMAALNEARRLGVTCIDDMGGSASPVRQREIRLYQELARQNKLTVRVDAYWPVSSWPKLADTGMQAGFGSDLVRMGGLKGFIDGSLGSSTAKFFDPYLHEKASSGVFLTGPSALGRQMIDADRAGLGLAIHAIGDQANATVLDLFAKVREAGAPPERRFRIEHAQHVRPADFEKFQALEVIASMQPYHVIDDGRWAEGRIGAERCESSYAYRSMLDAGVHLAFGSDWPVAPLDPLLGIDAAVNRRTLDGADPDGWFPEQRISVAEAIKAYTLGVAYARGQENELGSITPGKLGDMVLLDHDILDPAESDRITATKVTLTIFNGKVVYQP